MVVKAFRLRGRRTARWLAVSVCLVFLLVVSAGLAPAILSSRLCWPTVLSWLTSDLDGRVSTDSVSLGWFSPVVVGDVRVEDAQGQQVLQVAAVRTESSLLSLLFDSGRWGTIHVDEPRVTLVLRDDGSNVEDVLKSFLQDASPAGRAQGSIEISDGSIDVLDVAHTRIGQLSAIAATVQLPSDDGEGEVRITRCQSAVGTHAGAGTAEIQWRQGESSSTWSVSARIQGLGLALAGPLSKRWGTDLQVEGALTTDFTCQWDGARSVHMEVREASAEGLRLSAPAWLGTDQLAFQRLRAEGGCTVGDDLWHIRNIELACDAGHFTIDGRMAWQPGQESSFLRRLLASAASADLRVDGQIDLARLSQIVPATLRIRAGTAIERGMLEAQVEGHADGPRRVWSARLKTSDLAVLSDGRRVTWEEPWAVHLDAALGAQGWEIQNLDCQSSFLQLSGSGTSSSGTARLACDLGRTVAELCQIFDLGTLQAAGRMDSQLRWDRTDGADDRLAINATNTMDRCELAAAGLHWREPRLQSVLDAEVEMAGQQVARIATGRFTVTAGADGMDVHLRAPVALSGGDTVWSVGGTVRGELARWLARLRPFVPGGLTDARGAMKLEFTADVAPGKCDVSQLVFDSEPLHLSVPGLSVAEPTAHVELEGGWDLGRGQVTATNLIFQSAALAMRATDVVWSAHAEHPQLSGDVAFRADLARLHSSWQIPTWQEDWRAAGTAEGQVALVQQGSRTNARWSVDLAGLELARSTRTTAPGMVNVIPAAAASSWHTVWMEPTLRLAGSGQYDRTADSLQLDRLEVAAAETLKLSTAGRVARPWSECRVDLTGQITYDLAKLVERALPRSGVRFAGTDTQSFALQGPLFHLPGSSAVAGGSAADAMRGVVPRELAAHGALSWQSGNLLGVALGPGLLSASLANGTVDSQPIETLFSQGTLRVKPRLDLNHDPPLLTLEPGQVLTDVSLSPDLCRDWLKYIAPLVADVTSAEGKFGLTLQTAEIPLRQSAAAHVRGTLLIDSARLGPGPLALQLIDLGKRAEAIVRGRIPAAAASQSSSTWVSIPRQSTSFQWVDGRVHHDRFACQVDNAVLYSRGSVGLDQSLALVVQVPIQDAWLERDQRLALLRGLVVEVPIGGTLNNPRLDAKALEQLSAQVLRQGASRLLEEGINRGLQQLLK